MTSYLAARAARARRLLSIYVLVLRVKSRRVLLRAALVVLTATVMVTLGELVGHGLADQQAEQAASASPAPVSAPLPTACTPAPGELFNRCAVLDSSRIDYAPTPTADQVANAQEQPLCEQRGMTTAEDWSCITPRKR